MCYKFTTKIYYRKPYLSYGQSHQFRETCVDVKIIPSDDNDFLSSEDVSTYWCNWLLHTNLLPRGRYRLVTYQSRCKFVISETVSKIS